MPYVKGMLYDELAEIRRQGSMAYMMDEPENGVPYRVLVKCDAHQL